MLHNPSLNPWRSAACGAALILMLGTGPGVAQSVNPFAAVVTVNEDIITGYEIDQLVKFNALNLDRTVDEELRQEVIQYLIDTRVVARAAEQVGLRVDDDAVAQQLTEIAAATGSSEAEMIREYGVAGVDEATLRTVLHDQILWDRLLRARHGRQAQDEIDPVAVQEQITEYEREQEVQHHLFRISLGIIEDGDEAKDRAENLAQSIRRRLADGQSFADLAKRVSRAEDAERGGEVGWRSDAELDEQLRRLINAMAIGAVSVPIYLNDGEALIVHVHDRRVRTASEHIAPWLFDLQQVHYPIAEDADEDAVATAIEQLQQYREENTECAASAPDELPLEFDREAELSLADIGYGLRQLVLQLDIGGSTDITRRPDGLWYVQVCGRVGGVTEAGREQVTAVANDAIAQRRLTKLGEIYLKELRAQATIEHKSQ